VLHLSLMCCVLEPYAPKTGHNVSWAYHVMCSKHEKELFRLSKLFNVGELFRLSKQRVFQA
jgi:hypothetical protein